MSRQTIDVIREAIDAHFKYIGVQAELESFVVSASTTVISTDDDGDPQIEYGREYVSSQGNPWADIGLLTKILGDIDTATEYCTCGDDHD